MAVVSNSTIFFTISAFISALVLLFCKYDSFFDLDMIFTLHLLMALFSSFQNQLSSVCAVLKIPKTFSCSLRLFFFYVGFLSHTFTNHRTVGKEKGISFTPDYHLHPFHRHLDISWGDYCRELTSAHSHQPDSNRKPLVFKRKSLTTKLSSLRLCIHHTSVYIMHKH